MTADPRLQSLAESPIGRLALTCDDIASAGETIRNNPDVRERLIDETLADLDHDGDSETARQTLETIVTTFFEQADEYAALVDPDGDAQTADVKQTSLGAVPDEDDSAVPATGDGGGESGDQPRYEQVPPSHWTDRTEREGTNHHYILALIDSNPGITSRDVMARYFGAFPGEKTSVTPTFRELYDAGEVKRDVSERPYSYKITERGRESLAELDEFPGGDPS